MSTLCSEGKGSKMFSGGKIFRFLRHKNGKVYFSWQSTEPGDCRMPHAHRHEMTFPKRRVGWKLCQGRQDEPEGPREGGRASGTERRRCPSCRAAGAAEGRWKTNPATTGATHGGQHVPQTKQEMSSNSTRFCSYFHGSFFNYVRPD